MVLCEPGRVTAALGDRVFFSEVELTATACEWLVQCLIDQTGVHAHTMCTDRHAPSWRSGHTFAVTTSARTPRLLSLKTPSHRTRHSVLHHPVSPAHCSRHKLRLPFESLCLLVACRLHEDVPARTAALLSSLSALLPAPGTMPSTDMLDAQ